MKFSSLCILAYKRPEELKKCLESLYATIDSPCEVIINIDGGDGECRSIVESMPASKIIFNNGKNRGVGRSFQNLF
mgnify:CR=1 FL=1